MGSIRPKVNQHYCKEVLTKLREKVKEEREWMWKNGFIFHQDNPYHTGLSAKQFLTNTILLWKTSIFTKFGTLWLISFRKLNSLKITLLINVCSKQQNVIWHKTADKIFLLHLFEQWKISASVHNYEWAVRGWALGFLCK